jgi:hypothetical protein
MRGVKAYAVNLSLIPTGYSPLLQKPLLLGHIQVDLFRLPEQRREVSGLQDIALSLDFSAEKCFPQAPFAHPDLVEQAGRHGQLQVGASRPWTEENLQRRLAAIQKHLRVGILEVQADDQVAAGEILDGFWAFLHPPEDFLKNSVELVR